MDSQTPVVLETALPLPLFTRGKTRDVYDLGGNLLIVATDRISAFDVVLPCGIPDKGRVLTQLSAFWFFNTSRILPNHLVEVIHDAGRLDSYLPPGRRFSHPKYLEGRSLVVKKTKRIPVECVVRGYLSGSAWEEYKSCGTISGIHMPAGLGESQMLPEPLFTPTTKAEAGHDLPISIAEVEKLAGKALADEIKNKSLYVYCAGRDYAREKGFIIADTKFEFGLDGDKLILIDEAFTPDSSRFWDIDTYKVGQPQDSFDKQPVRDWLARSGWNKEPPGPMLPPEVIEQTSQRYRQAFERLTGSKLA
jgi:phosphoribosylaminoimidazole-succinocarboxamide synthase